MSKVTAIRAREKALREEPRLQPGAIAAAQLVRRDESGWTVRFLDGFERTATSFAGVSAELLSECLQDGRVVLVSSTGTGLAIVGALQTAVAPRVDEQGHLALKARSISVESKDELRLQCGDAGLTFQAEGAARLSAQRLNLDIPEAVRVRSARVELP